jgi:hypothetical protein
VRNQALVILPNAHGETEIDSEVEIEIEIEVEGGKRYIFGDW